MSSNFKPDFGAPKLKDILKFEFISWYGRKFRKSKSRIKIKETPLLIDLGCGSNFGEGWVNVDFYKKPRIDSFLKKSNNRVEFVESDFRYPINCEDNCADGIYCGHTIEHFYPKEAYFFLSEIFRILKPHCWLRINFPDLEKYINYYTGKNMESEFLVFKTGCEAVSTITQNYGHHSAWDLELITEVLDRVGFINIKQVDFGCEGTDPRLIKEEPVRKWETLVVEAQKPFHLNDPA